MDTPAIHHPGAATHTTGHHHSLAYPLPRAKRYTDGYLALEPAGNRQID